MSMTEFARFQKSKSNPEDLCENFDSIRITSERKPVGAAARCKRAQFMRHCAACDKDGKNRAVRSAHQPRNKSSSGASNNGLARKTQVPRPRTPYARRSFCIDTLAPPFSVVTGCRDADYPEHWRLTSVYQQSYRNPRKSREARTLLGYERRSSYV